MKHLSPPRLVGASRLVQRSPHKGCTAFVCSVLEGRTGGQVTVDSETAPCVAIVAARTTAYLFTEPDFTNIETLGPFLREYLQLGVSDEGITLWATTPEQVAVLQALFSLERGASFFPFPRFRIRAGLWTAV